MITLNEAIAIVENYLELCGTPCEIIEVHWFQKGWYFLYQSKEFLETGRISSQLIDNLPILVDRNNSSLTVMDRIHDLSINEILNEYVNTE